MKIILLSSGRSLRLNPIPDKNFLTFFGETLAEMQVKKLVNSGLVSSDLRDLIVVGGKHNIQRLRALFPSAKIVEQLNLDEGMAGGILSAESEMTQNEDMLILSNNDFLDDSAFLAMKHAINKMSIAKAQLTSANYISLLLATEMNEYFPGGYLRLEDERIIDIQEKPGEGNEPSNLINIVLHYHQNAGEIFEAIKLAKSANDDKYEIALKNLMAKRYSLVRHSGKWQAIKEPAHVLRLMNDLLENSLGVKISTESPKNSSPAKNVQIDPSAVLEGAIQINEDVQISSGVRIEGPVILSKGVKILNGACIKGPVFIGENCVVGNNAFIRDSMIGNNVIIGFSSEIVRSYIEDSCTFHMNYIGDSIISHDCHFGGGAILANYRLDEGPMKKAFEGGAIGGIYPNKLGAVIGPKCRIGVNTSIMPGIKIGKKTWIASGLTISENIESGKFVSGKMELLIRENHSIM